MWLQFPMVINSKLDFWKNQFLTKIRSRRHPRGTQEACRGTQRHPGGTQEAPRRHPGAQGAPEGIFLINRHHSHAKDNNLPKLVILRCVFEGPSRIRWYLQGKMRERSLDVATDRSRALYQHRKNPYSQKLFGESPNYQMGNAYALWAGQPAGQIFQSEGVATSRCWWHGCPHHREKYLP